METLCKTLVQEPRWTTLAKYFFGKLWQSIVQKHQRMLGSNLPSYGQIELWNSTSHNNTLNEGWCETWHHITIHSRDLTSHNNTLNEGWCETVVWDLTSHKNKHVAWAMFWEMVRKGSGDEEKWWGREVVTKRSGDEGSVVTLHHIRMHSMKGGVRQWCETVVWDTTSLKNTLNEGWWEIVVWDLASHNHTLTEGWCENIT